MVLQRRQFAHGRVDGPLRRREAVGPTPQRAVQGDVPGPRVKAQPHDLRGREPRRPRHRVVQEVLRRPALVALVAHVVPPVAVGVSATVQERGGGAVWAWVARVRQGCPRGKNNRRRYVPPRETKIHGDALCFVVKTWAELQKYGTMVTDGGWWRFAVGGGWRPAVGGPWGLSLTRKSGVLKDSSGVWCALHHFRRAHVFSGPRRFCAIQGGEGRNGYTPPSDDEMTMMRFGRPILANFDR